MTATVGDAGRMTPAGARSIGISYQELLKTDTRAVPGLLTTESPMEPGVTRVPAERYYAKRIHDLEVEKLWKRVWQMAGREEDIPNVGDYLVYDIASLSFLVVRTRENEIKAFHNACLHRGRQLREWAGTKATEFRCPFHGWCWELDGTLKEVVNQWDFPEVNEKEYHLPEVKVGTWAGFIFINPDTEAGSLEDFLGDLPKHFARWPLEKRFKQAHVAKILRCNWKAGQEAFMEAYHVVATHPQLLASLGDSNSQYDVFGNFARAISPGGVPSPHMRAKPSEQEVLNALFDRQLDDPELVTVPEGTTARELAASMGREQMRGIIGAEADTYCDAEYTDSFYFTQFPNFHPWGGFNRIVYRFRPNGDNPDECIMECMFLSPWPEGEPRPPAAPIHFLDADQDWVEAPELGMLARVFNQDVYNLPKVQVGLKAMKNPEVVFASYGETKIRHFHRLWEAWVSVE
jgi:phenylpropionate dioxygenase-like ring-hydroxylating dioxygenase large terminal subunit